jgi:hypothetical protein
MELTKFTFYENRQVYFRFTIHYIMMDWTGMLVNKAAWFLRTLPFALPFINTLKASGNYTYHLL